MSQRVSVFLTIAGEQDIPAEIFPTGRRLNGIALDILCLGGVYFAIHAPYHGAGEITFTAMVPQLPYTAFNVIRINGKIAGYKKPADVLRIILALPTMQPLEVLN
jgi:hypothetical protein